jgi:hypothetical protein
MGLIFFATDGDLTDVSSWLFQVPGMRFFEEYSAPDQQNRWFEEPDEIADLLRNGAHTLAAWPSGVGGKPEQKEVVFSKAQRDELGASGRTVLTSPAIIRVNRNTDLPGCLNPFSISCWTERGARQRSMYDEEVLNSVAWPKLASIVSGIQRQIRKSSPGKLHSYPIMPAAYTKLVDGDVQLWNWGEKVGYPSSYITSTNVR